MAETHNKPSKVSAEAGQVLVEGPGGIIVSMTPDAAIETSDRLMKEGVRAQEQNGPPDNED